METTNLAPQQTSLTMRVPLADIERLDALSVECAQIQRTEMTPFRRTFMMAAGMQQLRNCITPEMMQDVMFLQGSPLGFRTDRDDKPDGHGKFGYPLETVREVAIEATLRGLRLTGNEINIIAGRMYAAKDGLKRLVYEWPGLTNLQYSKGVPRKAEGYTVVPCRASWMLGGEKQTLDCTGENSIPIRVNTDGKGGEQIVDAILGKAERKLFDRILQRLLGYDPGLVEQDGPAAVPNISLPGPNDEAIKALVGDYGARIAAAVTQNEVPAIIREASKDTRLDETARKEVTRVGNAKLTELRLAEKQGRGRTTTKPAQQQFIDPSIEDHTQLIAEWTDVINQADSFARFQEIQENAKSLPNPVQGYVMRLIAEKMKKFQL